MKIQSKRAQIIEAHKNSKKPVENMHERVEIGGQAMVLPVYAVPITMLMYNIRNGRFASELLSKEKALGHPLDATRKADAKIITKLLLDQSESETKALREDIVRNGQIAAGIITSDGAVINANRRMAIISTLHEETGDALYENLKVAILPSDVDEKDLWRIEAGLQFAKDFRLEYGPINELLKLKEGLSRKLTPKEISASLLGRYTDKEVLERIEVLKLIDSYLDAINCPGEYQHIHGGVEKFNSLRSHVEAPFAKSEEISPVDRAFLVNAAFAMVKADNFTHWDIRKLNVIAKTPKAFAEFKKNVDLPNPIQTAQAALTEGFTAASEIVEDQKEKDKPERLLKKAKSALENINQSSAKLKTSAIKAVLSDIKVVVDELIAASKK